MGESYCVVCKRNELNEKWICTLGVFLALAFVADFPPVAPEFHQRTHRVRLRNLGTTDKKIISQKQAQKDSESTLYFASGVLCFLLYRFLRKKPWQELLSTLQKLRRLAGKKQNQPTGVISNIFLV